MTFPLVSYGNSVPRPIVALFKFIHAVAQAFLLILCFIGLYEFTYNPEDHAPLINGGRRPLNGDGPLPETVKKRLPAVEFVQLVERSPLSTNRTAVGRHDEDGYGEATTCRVCLERLEATDEVRRLGNCTHAFHRGCIDRWIDLGEVTCPLCRSLLLPRQRGGLLGRARIGLFPRHVCGDSFVISGATADGWAQANRPTAD